MIKKTTDVVNTSGKRKTAIARATVKKGKGLVRINNTPLSLYQPEIARWKILEPITLFGDKASSVNIDVDVKGGGFMSQANAVRTAIARGLVLYSGDANLKVSYINYDRSLLVNDSRRKEAKKPLGRGARKRRQKSYR
ncbi:MAG: 30S ribosomal protein S9 [Candidatus Thermoplasmatota archaeon]|nr:30S ribosomal protein S9 [Candidatus Thermoplasmatota archaeon]